MATAWWSRRSPTAGTRGDVVVQPDGGIVSSAPRVESGIPATAHPGQVPPGRRGSTRASAATGSSSRRWTGSPAASSYGVALGPGGTLVTSGFGCDRRRHVPACGALVARFTSAGVLDATFGDGRRIRDPSERPVIPQRRGRPARRRRGRPRRDPAHSPSSADGDPDPTFGGGDGIAELEPDILDAGPRAGRPGAGCRGRRHLRTHGTSGWPGSRPTVTWTRPSRPAVPTGPGILRMDLSSVVDVQYAADAATAVTFDDSGRVLVGGGHAARVRRTTAAVRPAADLGGRAGYVVQR